MAAVDLTGQVFGRLLVVRRIPTEKGRSRWFCRCSCGNVKEAWQDILRRGNCRSCGCLMAEAKKAVLTRHGWARTRLYRIWRGMRIRCSSAACDSYANYGGKGISVSEEWVKDFVIFRDWALSHGYTDDLTLERDDINGNYCPENCRWVTPREQYFNKENTLWVEYNGEKVSIARLAMEHGIPHGKLARRVKRGMDISLALDKHYDGRGLHR